MIRPVSAGDPVPPAGRAASTPTADTRGSSGRAGIVPAPETASGGVSRPENPPAASDPCDPIRSTVLDGTATRGSRSGGTSILRCGMSNPERSSPLGVAVRLPTGVMAAYSGASEGVACQVAADARDRSRSSSRTSGTVSPAPDRCGAGGVAATPMLLKKLISPGVNPPAPGVAGVCGGSEGTLVGPDGGIGGCGRGREVMEGAPSMTAVPLPPDTLVSC